MKNLFHVILFFCLYSAAVFYAGRITKPETESVKARNLETESTELVNRQIKLPNGTIIAEQILRKAKKKSASVEKTAAPLKPLLYKISLIPNYNFATAEMNYAFIAEKKFIGELSLGVFINLDFKYRLNNAGAVASYEF